MARLDREAIGSLPTQLGRVGRDVRYRAVAPNGSPTAQSRPALVLALAAPDAVRLLDAVGPAAAGGHDGAVGTDRLRAGDALRAGRDPLAVGMEEDLEIHVPAGGVTLPVPVGHQCGGQSGSIGHDDHPLLRPS